jgi:hypothetical protein
MSDWERLNCVNHPGRIALERCEVCGKPLCAYCLYYTEDGQRLCAEHAETARELGVHVDDPDTYAAQLIGAQVGATRKQKRDERSADKDLYRGNSTDVSALIAMILGLTSIGMCCGAAYCLPVIGFGLSLVALLNAKKAHDVGRTRRLGIIGLITSGVLVLAVVACLAFYTVSITSVMTSFSNPSFWQNLSTYTAPTDTPTHTPTGSPAVTPNSTETPGATLTPTPHDAEFPGEGGTLVSPPGRAGTPQTAAPPGTLD